MKPYLLLGVLFAGPALGQTPAAPPHVDPAIQALGEMVQGSQAREAQALARAYAAEDKVKDLTAQLAEEKKRADAAEAKLPEGVPKP